MFGLHRQLAARRLEGEFHGIERIALAGQDGVLQQRVELLGEVADVRADGGSAVADSQLLERHPILGERSGLVHA